MDITQEAYNQAKKVLKDCISDIGLKASALSDGYPQVWARDSMITSLGALLVDDQAFIDTTYKSLSTLRDYQTDLGLIPNNVDIENKEANFRAYMDGNMWFVLGVHNYFRHTQDKEFLKEFFPAVKKTLTWISYQNVDNTNLISMQEAADWEDLLAIQGKPLYDNVLYYAALKAADTMARELGEKTSYATTAQNVYTAIQEWLWVQDGTDEILDKLKGLSEKYKSAQNREEVLITLAQSVPTLNYRPYFLSYRSFRQFGSWFDSFGNTLAIITGVANDEQTKKIVRFIKKMAVAEPFPIKAIYPAILPGEKEWRDYYVVHNLNLPHQYHNGAVWPFVGGFYVLALKIAGMEKEAKSALVGLAEANKRGIDVEWGFNEWMHGITGRPMGNEYQAWSAAMYIAAYEAVVNNKRVM